MRQIHFLDHTSECGARGRVALVADSGGVYALYDRRDKHHTAVSEAVLADAGPLIILAAILAEIDYLLRTKLGSLAETRFLDGVVSGVFAVEPFTDADAVRCRELLLKYKNLDLGLADASGIATAERLGVTRIITLDERDFRAVRTRKGAPFLLIPADKPVDR